MANILEITMLICETNKKIYEEKKHIGTKGSLNELMNELMNDKAVYRTAPATPGLLISSALGFLDVSQKLIVLGKMSC